MPVPPLLSVVFSVSWAAISSGLGSAPFLCSLLTLPFLLKALPPYVLYLSLTFWHSLFPNNLSSVWPYRKASAGFFDRARKRGSGQDKNGIDGAQVHKTLKPGTKRRCTGAMRLWSS